MYMRPGHISNANATARPGSTRSLGAQGRAGETRSRLATHCPCRRGHIASRALNMVCVRDEPQRWPSASADPRRSTRSTSVLRRESRDPVAGPILRPPRAQPRDRGVGRWIDQPSASICTVRLLSSPMALTSNAASRPDGRASSASAGSHRPWQLEACRSCRCPPGGCAHRSPLLPASVASCAHDGAHLRLIAEDRSSIRLRGAPSRPRRQPPGSRAPITAPALSAAGEAAAGMAGTTVDRPLLNGANCSGPATLRHLKRTVTAALPTRRPQRSPRDRSSPRRRQFPAHQSE
jgi:hypothetical protein